MSMPSKLKDFSYALFLLLAISGCSNPYSKYYQNLVAEENFVADNRIAPPPKKPRLTPGVNIAADEVRMLENGYHCIGISSFSAGIVNPKIAIHQAKKVRADIVIVHYNAPYTIRRYYYYASYWVKMKTPRLGIIWGDLTDEFKRQIGSNEGAYVRIVINGSPAFGNGILSGDVICRVNGIETPDDSYIERILSNKQISELELEIFREGETITKKIKLNP